jgi:hypothetical protein
MRKEGREQGSKGGDDSKVIRQTITPVELRLRLSLQVQQKACQPNLQFANLAFMYQFCLLFYDTGTIHTHTHSLSLSLSPTLASQLKSSLEINGTC